MARIPRQELIDETEVGMYHCVNRCVRRAFLCGEDPFTGKNFDHRKGWIRQRLEFLAGEFGIDVCGFAVMSNHVHVVLRNRPDVVVAWSDQEVARRWWNLFPSRREEDGSPAKPRAHELEMLTADAQALKGRKGPPIFWLERTKGWVEKGWVEKGHPYFVCTPPETLLVFGEIDE